MTAPNHIVGGITITGICGGFIGVNVLESPWYLATIVFAAQLPDIDHTKSIIGLTFYPLAKFINRRYGHRSITHSLACLLFLSLVAGMASIYFTGTKIYGTIFFLAYLSHLIIDMTTVQGIPLFYPFVKNPCVVPGDPNMRFESGNLRTEAMAFFFFVAMGVFMQPLMENGFWTQYNRAFGTMKHLYSEFNKSEDLLLVKFTGLKGSERVQGRGYVVKAEKEKAMLLRDDGFFELNKKDLVIEEVIPEHTGKQFFFQNQTFVNVDLDSLNALCIDRLITKIEVHSNNQFIAWTEDLTNAASRQFKGEWYGNLFFQEKEKEVQKVVATYRHVINPRIQFLRDKIKRLQNLQTEATSSQEMRQAKLRALRLRAKNEMNYVERESLLTRIKQLETAPAEKSYLEQIQTTQIQLQETIEIDRLKRQEGNLKAVEQNRVGEEQVQLTRFTGFITTLSIPD